MISVLAGIVCGALPFLLLFLREIGQSRALRHELLSYQELEDTYHSAALWVLNTSLNAGDTIQEEDCVKVIVKTQDVTDLSLPDSGESLAGLSAKTALKAGCILSDEMFYDAKAHEEDSYLLELTDLPLPSSVSADDFIDIRIRFPNGEDYIVISHLTVQKLLADETETYGLWLELKEEELLRLSSAKYDRDVFEGCELYVTEYTLDFQESSTSTYPVNPDVFTLMEWDPNIVKLFTVESEQEKRTLLESHLNEFFQKGNLSTGNQTSAASAEDEDDTSSLSEDDGAYFAEETDDPDSSATDSLTVYHP